MSSLANTQNLLINVFRPKYTYESNFFQTKLDMSNLDTLFANVLVSSNAYIGDSRCNVYVGTGAGNSYTTPQASSRNVAIGQFAGNSISNVSNSTFLGYNAGNGVINSSNAIMIGANTYGNGNSNILIGNDVRLAGTSSNNIIIGNGIQPPNPICNVFQLGRGTGDITMSGDLVNHGIGIGLPQIRDTAFALDVSGYVHISNAGLGVNADPRDHTLNVAGDMLVSDGYGTFAMSNDGSLASTLNYGPATPAKNATMTVNGTLNVSNGLNVYGPLYIPNVSSLNVPGTIIASNVQSKGFFSVMSNLFMTNGQVLSNIWTAPSISSLGRLEISVMGLKFPTTSIAADYAYWDLRTDVVFGIIGSPLVKSLILDVSGAGAGKFVAYRPGAFGQPYALDLSNVSGVDLIMKWNVTFYPSFITA